MQMEESYTKTGKDIKLCFNDHNKKKKIVFYDIESYDKMILQIARILGYGALNCRFVYKDDEKENITVSNNEDLQEAFSLIEGDVLKLKLVLYEREINPLSSSKLYRADSDDEDGNETFHFDHEQIETDDSEDSDEDLKSKQRLKLQKAQNPQPAIPKIDKKLDNSANKNVKNARQISEEEALLSLNDDFDENCNNKIIQSEANRQPSGEISEPDFEDQIKYDGFIYPSENQEIDLLFNIDYIRRKVHEIAYKELNVLIPQILDSIKAEEAIEHNQESQPNIISDIVPVEREETKEYENILVQEESHSLDNKIIEDPELSIKEPVAVVQPKQKDLTTSCVQYKIKCNKCNASPLTGVRYICITCRDYDLCERCEAKCGHPHPLMKIKNENQFKQMIMYFSDEENVKLLESHLIQV